MADEKFYLNNINLGSTAATPVGEKKLDLGSINLDTPSAVPRGALENAPDDSWLTSTAKAIPTTIIKGLSHIPGQIGDIREGGQYLGRRLVGAFTGETPEQQETKGAKLRARAAAENPLLAKALSVIPSTDVMPTGHDISAPVLKRTGEYVPTSTAGRYAMDAGEAGLSMLGPAGGIKGGVTKGSGFARAPAVDLAKSVLKQGATPTALGLGAAGGAGASAATDAMEDPLYGMAAAPLTSAAAALAGAAAKKRFPMWTDRAATDRAAKQFAKSVGDREGVLNAPETNPLGTKMTTAEASGDINLARSEAALEGTDQTFAARMQKMRGENASTRQQHMQTFADPDANPMALADAYVQQLDALHRQQAEYARQRLGEAENVRTGTKDFSNKVNQTTQELHDAAVAEARARAEGAPAPNAVDRSTTGDAARELAEEGNRVVGADVTRLYNAVNPDRNLNVVTQGSVGGARQMLEDFNPAVQKKSPGHDYVEMVAALPEVLPFHDLVKLDQTITAGMADFKNTNRAAHGQLTALKDMVQSDLRNALENQIAWEQRAVANGTMAADETIGARLAAEARDYLEQSRSGARTGTGDNAGVGAPGVSATRGTNGEGGGPGVLAGDGPVPNFTPEDLARYTEAKQRHIDRVEGWRSGPVGDALKTSGFSGDYKMPGSKVAATIFKKGDGGGENINAWLRGANGDPQMLQLVQDLASTSLHEAATKAGGLTPDVLTKWRNDYAPALRRLDEEVPGFSNRFNDTATARQALEEAETARAQALKASESERAKQHKAADTAYDRTAKDVEKEVAATLREGEQRGAQFTSRDSTEDMRRGVGRVLSADDSAAQIGRILDDVGHDPAAVNGLRKAAADWMVENFASTVTASGDRGVQPKMSKFIAGREETLRRLYGDEGLQTIQLLAEDMDRTAAHMSARASIGSPTSSNMASFAKELLAHAESTSTWNTLTGAIGLHAMMSQSWYSALTTAGLILDKTAGAYARNRAAEKVRGIMSDAMADPAKGKLLLQHAIDAEGRPNMAALAPLLAPIRSEQPDDDRARESARPARAEGGRVGILDHIAEAAKYVRMAARAKADHSRKTESFLKVPDAAVAKALAIAHEAI